MAIINNLALSYKKKKDYIKALKFFDMVNINTMDRSGYYNYTFPLGIFEEGLLLLGNGGL